MINVELYICIKIEIAIIDIAEFFLNKQGPFKMIPINKMNNSFFELGLPVNFPKSVAGLYFFGLYFLRISFITTL